MSGFYSSNKTVTHKKVIGTCYVGGGELHACNHFVYADSSAYKYSDNPTCEKCKKAIKRFNNLSVEKYLKTFPIHEMSGIFSNKVYKMNDQRYWIKNSRYGIEKRLTGLLKMILWIKKHQEDTAKEKVTAVI